MTMSETHFSSHQGPAVGGSEAKAGCPKEEKPLKVGCLHHLISGGSAVVYH